jgi:hypothetical protein
MLQSKKGHMIFFSILKKNFVIRFDEISFKVGNGDCKNLVTILINKIKGILFDPNITLVKKIKDFLKTTFMI